MAEHMKRLVKTGVELSVEERNLLSVAYKNKIGARRASWRIVEACQEKLKGVNKDYREEIEQELRDICKEILGLLEDYLISKESTDKDEKKVAEAKVFFLKM